MFFGLFKKKQQQQIDPGLQARIEANNRAYEAYMNAPEPPSEVLELCHITLSNGAKYCITAEDALNIRIENNGAFIKCQIFNAPRPAPYLHPKIGFVMPYGSHRGWIPAQGMYGRGKIQSINPTQVVMIGEPFKRKVEKRTYVQVG